MPFLILSLIISTISFSAYSAPVHWQVEFSVFYIIPDNDDGLRLSGRGNFSYDPSTASSFYVVDPALVDPVFLELDPTINGIIASKLEVNTVLTSLTFQNIGDEWSLEDIADNLSSYSEGSNERGMWWFDDFGEETHTFGYFRTNELDSFNSSFPLFVDDRWIFKSGENILELGFSQHDSTTASGYWEYWGSNLGDGTGVRGIGSGPFSAHVVSHAVPVPGVIYLLGSGLIGLIMLRVAIDGVFSAKRLSGAV